MQYNFSKRTLWGGLLGALLMLLAPHVQAQFANKWLSGGSFHNWYSEIGSECETCGFIRSQQDGWRWPGIYNYTDMQAARSLWVGAKNVVDDKGTSFPVRVVHVGPRVTGAGEFFPVSFKLLSRFALPAVTVDGTPSEPSATMVVDEVKSDLEADFVLENVSNTLLGLTMKRRVLQFQQEFNDNYHVIEYTFTNTGNTDGDTDIELPNQTLTDVMVYLQTRMAVAKETRYVIGNGSGWGMNTMIDARGDGLRADPADQNFRAQFVWHGKFPAFTKYDNIGGPILKSALPALQIAAADTLGRLGASQFAGTVVLHADKSATDKADDPAQPTTMNYIGSDDNYLSQNSAYDPTKMDTEYRIMAQGRRPRHAFIVEPSGDAGFKAPTGDPALGSSGGYSGGLGFGPYTIKPGESIKIVMADAAAGISRAENIRVGRLLQQNKITNAQKNDIVFQGRDSLFTTFRRAIANYGSNYQIPKAPLPPSEFNVNSGGDRIQLSWTPASGQTIDGWEIYRTKGSYDSTYTMIKKLPAGDTSFDDTTPIRGVPYFYYIQAYVDKTKNPGGAGTPANRVLRSSRYFAQTYSAAQLKRPAGNAWDDVRIVPNPYTIAASADLRFAANVRDRLAFFDIPGQCTIEIYTELGELVDTITHTDGSGDAYWDHTTSSRQLIVSGVYIAVITATDDQTNGTTGELEFRKGERKFMKFVIIR